MSFVFQSASMGDYIYYIFSEACLIMGHHLFYLPLDLVYKYFIGIFTYMFRRDIGQLTFFVMSLCGLYIRVTVDFLKGLDSVPVSVFCNNLRSIGVNC